MGMRVVSLEVEDQVEGSGLCKGCRLSYLWFVGNGGMGTIISTITTILPFPTAPGVALSFSSEELVSRFGAEGLGLPESA